MFSKSFIGHQVKKIKMKERPCISATFISQFKIWELCFIICICLLQLFKNKYNRNLKVKVIEKKFTLTGFLYYKEFMYMCNEKKMQSPN